MEYPENILSIIFFIGGLVPVLTVIKIFYFYKVTIKQWKNTVGCIIIYENASNIDGGWKKRVSFTYRVSDKLYQSENITNNMTLSVPFEYQVEQEDKYNIGNEIVVYYNPVKPSNCVVVNSFNYYNLFVLIFSIISFIVACHIWK